MSTKFACDYARRNSGCKKCKKPIDKTSLRLAKIVPNAFSESADEMKQYYHLVCLFDTFARARATTRVLETVGELEGYAALEDGDKKLVRLAIEALEVARSKKLAGKKRSSDPEDVVPRKVVASTPVNSTTTTTTSPTSSTSPTTPKSVEYSDSWNDFVQLCARIGKSSKYTDKTEIIRRFIRDESYTGDVHLLIKTLLPSIDQRVYNVKEKALVKHFAAVFGTHLDDMTEHYQECGQVEETIAHFFSRSTSTTTAASRSTLTLQSVDEWLDQLTKVHGEEAIVKHFRSIARRSTVDDLRAIVRQIMSDLRVNCGVKYVMEALGENAHAAFESCRNLRQVVDKALIQMSAPPGVKKAMSVGITLQQPVRPMLAEACRSVEFAFKRCPRGMLAEIKYDGERVQVHKTAADEFSFYSRSLKPVVAHKVADVRAPLIQAFATSVSCILDCEVLVVDTKTGKPLPFGTLGKNKKASMASAQTCLYVFDMLMYGGESLMTLSLMERKALLHKHMTPVTNRVLFSSYEHIRRGDRDKLATMIDSAIDDGLEGLVMKDVDGLYEPGKRHWLKVKKDYLAEGTMADSADLLVLGAYYGTGSKGGLMSVFLMGVHDAATSTYRTVTKCGNGHDNATLDRINEELGGRMTRINGEASRVPSWLSVSSALAPDLVIDDPTTAPVWEIAGAEFSKSSRHTAGGVSIRFPRVTKIRDDKDYETATSLQELLRLYAASKATVDIAGERAPLTASELAGGGASSTTNGLADMLSSNVFSGKADDNAPPDSTLSSSTTPASTPSSSSMKRSHEKATIDDNRPMCKYGASCYQRNPAHKKQYRHDVDEAPEERKPTTSTTPTFFRFHHVHIVADDDEVRERLRRHIEHYGGAIVEQAGKLQPGHYVVVGDNKSRTRIVDYLKTSGVTVDVEALVLTTGGWVTDCVRQKKLTDIKDLAD